LRYSSSVSRTRSAITALRSVEPLALQKVERDFRTMKTGLLEIRPVFVRKESRTRGHVFCSMLALKLQREVERRLAA
jgi:hypothetical protein